MRVFLPSDGLASGHSPAKPCGFPVLCTPAQAAQGWLRTQPDSGPSQLLAFMRFLRAQSQFSTLGEREEARIHLSPASHSQREGPQELTKAVAYFKYLGGWEFPRKSWFRKKAQTPRAGTLLWTELHPTKFICWSPNPQCVGVWRWASKALANPQSPLLIDSSNFYIGNHSNMSHSKDRSTTILKWFTCHRAKASAPSEYVDNTIKQLCFN